MARTTVVAGVGETLGTALARRFADAGDDLALLARSEEVIDPLAAELRERGDDSGDAGGDAVAITADVTDPEAVEAAFDRVRERLGGVDVLVHNASAPAGDGLETTPGEFEHPWRVRAYGGYLCAREAAREMVGDWVVDPGTEPPDDPGDADGNLDRDRSIVFAGTSLATDPSGRTPGWDSAAAATRGLARSLAHTLEPHGVHVAYVAIGGTLAPPGGYVTADRMRPGAVADELLGVVQQDPSAWSRELELAPRDWE